MYRVDSLFNLRIIEGTPDGQGNTTISSRPVLGSVPRDDVEALDARARAISNPLYIDNIFSDDGTATAIIVTVNDIEGQEDFSLAVYRQFEWLINNPDIRVQLEGHCDERGTNEYNLALGERRARSVLNYLLRLGASPEQFSIVSFGEERPVALGQNETAWQKNRRVEFTRL